MVKQKKSFKILVASDIHGNAAISESLAIKAEKNNADLVILAGDLTGSLESSGFIHPFKKRNQKVLFVPGNWDSSADASLMSDFYKIRNIDGYYASYEGVDIIGVGNPDFRLKLNEKNTLDRLAKNFEKVKNKPSTKILVSHLHAANTLPEFSGFRGEKSLLKAINYFQPDIFISGHIHEAEGLEQKIGKTKVISVGRRGKIIKIKLD